MGKYLDKTGLQYFYNKLKDKFADKSTIETKLDSLTGAFTWKGELSALPTDLSSYSAGNVIKVGTKEYVCTETNGTKAWDELGDEGSYLLKTAAESTYLKKAAGEVKTDNLADGSVTSEKINKLILTKDTTTISLPWFEELRTSGTKNECVYYYINGAYIPLIAHNNVKISPTGEDTFDGVDLFFSGVETSSTVCNARLLFAEVCFYKDKSNSIELDTNIYDSQFLLSAINAADFGEDPYFKGENIIDESIVIEKLSTDVQTSLGKADTALQSIADKSITKAKLDSSVQTSLGKADNSLQIGTNKIIEELVIENEMDNNSVSFPIIPTGASLCFTNGVGTSSEYSRYIILDGADKKFILTSDAGVGDVNLGGIAEPTSDTDAANKKYVDDNIIGTTFDCGDIQALPDWQVASFSRKNFKFVGEDYLGSSDWEYGWIPSFEESYGGAGDGCDEVKYMTFANLKDLTLTYKSYGSVRKYDDSTGELEPLDDNGMVKLNKNETVTYKLVDQSTLATSLQAITIYTDNTAEHKAANLANIKAYGDNLKELGFTTTNDHNIPINIYGTTQKGFIGGNTASNRYHGIMGADNQWQMFVVAPDGIFVSSPVLGGVISQLNTTNKTSVVSAINEVNTLAKSKASTSVATQSANGLMSAADKKKLDNTLQLGEENVGSDTYTTLKNNYLNLTVENSADYENGILRLAGNALEFFDSSNNRTVLKGINSKTIAVGDYDSSGTSVSGGTITGLSTPTNDSDAATKAYVDSKSSEKVTLAYNPDDSYMTGEQYKSIFTDAYENSKIPNVELVYTAEGDYQVLSLTRVDKDDSYYHLYFSCSSAEDSANVYTYGVKVDVLRESDDTTVNHDMTCTELQSTSFNTIAKTVANNVDSTGILTASTVTKSLTMADKKNFIIMPTVTAAQIRLPSSPTDGYTITVVGVATIQNFELKTASSNAPIYNVGGNSTATKFSLSTRGKVISTYSATLKQWITYKQSIA